MFSTFADSSRVWVYPSSRDFTDEEVNQISLLLQQFCISWTAHGSNLKAHGEVRHHRFIILMADETHAGASGCSIDKSVHFMKELEKAFNTSLFNRMLVAYQAGEEVRVVEVSEIKNLISEGNLNAETPVFNTLVTTKAELDRQFLIPLKESWLSRFLQTVKT